MVTFCTYISFPIDRRMKYSIYNSIINVTEHIILLFNSFTDSFFFLNRILLTDLKKPQSIKDKNLKLYRKLVSKGIYIDERINEFDRLNKYTNENILDESSFFLIVNPTMNCNLQCWYCYEKHITSCMSKDIYDRITLLIENIIKKGISTFTLGFFGGEPLMEYKKIVLPLIDYTYNICRKYNIKMQQTFTTNGTLLAPKMIEELCKYGKPSFQITLDGDESSHNKVRFFKNNKGTYTIILHNIKYLLEKECYVTLRINYTKDNIKTVWTALDEFITLYHTNQKFLTIDFHRVWQDKENNNTLQSVKLMADKLAEAGFDVRYNELNEIKNACYGDKKNTAVINYNGDVFKCTARDFTKENREGLLDETGNIIWEKSQEHRLSLKLKNPLCHHCRIAPLCGSGCSRYILEQESNKDTYCVFNQKETEMNEFIIGHVQSIIRNLN